MNEPEPMPAFTFSPDGPTTITHPDGTVSVHDPQSDDSSDATSTATDVSATATPAGDTLSTTIPPEPPDPQPEVTSIVAESSGDSGMPSIDTAAPEVAVPADLPATNEPPDWGETPADTSGSDSVVNPDGSITTRLPDGSTQTVARLPSGRMIVTNTTPPGADPQPAPPDSPRSRGWRRRGR